MKARCSIEDCEKPAGYRGWCTKHYQRWLAHGDPLACAVAYSERGSLVAWIEAHKTHQGDDCLIWPFFRDRKGYGRIRVNRKNMTAARFMCIAVHGDEPTMHAAHSCGKGHEGCVNPNHLRWATKAENEADKKIHGTVVRGEVHPHAKLTAEQVAAIRDGYKKTWGEQTHLARAYGVSTATISSIVTGRKWRGSDNGKS